MNNTKQHKQFQMVLSELHKYFYYHQYDERFRTFRCADMVSEFDMDGDKYQFVVFYSSKEKGGSGAHDHSRHKIFIHSKFPRHKITLKNQQFYLSIFYSSPSTKHATRLNFQLNHSNPCKLHQNEPHHTKVDSSAHQTRAWRRRCACSRGVAG